MTKGNESKPTGFGISTRMCDNSYPIIVIDCEKQEIGYAPEPTDAAPIPIPTKSVSFKDFCAKPAKWPNR